MLKVYDTFSEKYIEHFYIDAHWNIWIDSDPNGVDMTGRRRIHFGNILKNPDRYKLTIEPISDGS